MFSGRSLVSHLDRVKRNEKSYAHTRCRMIRNIEKTVLMTVTVYLKQQAKSVDQIIPNMQACHFSPFLHTNK